MAVSLAPSDWRFPPPSTAPMDHQSKQSASSSSSAKSSTTSPTTPSPGRANDSPAPDARHTPPQISDGGGPPHPMNGQFVPGPFGVPPNNGWSPQQQQQQPGFAYPGMYGYFQPQQGQFPPYPQQQQPTPEQFAQWAAYQQLLFNAQQQQQQHMAAAAMAGGMLPRQRTGSSPQAVPDLAQGFMPNGIPPGMMNANGTFMPFPNGAPGGSGMSSGRGSAASEPSNNQNQTFHPYRRTRGSQSSSNNNTPSSTSSPVPAPVTIAGHPSSAFPPLQAAQPPYARERTNSNSSNNSSRSSRSNSRQAPGRSSTNNGPAPPVPPVPVPHQRSASAPGQGGPNTNGRITPSQSRSSDSSSRPSAPRSGSSSTSTSPPPPRARTPSTSSAASSSASSPSTTAPPLPTAPGSSQNNTNSGSVRSRAPPKPSPLSQQPSISAVGPATDGPTPTTATSAAGSGSGPTTSMANKRLSRDDSELKAYGETVHPHVARSTGLKGRLRRALSLSPSGTLNEEDEKLGSRKAVVAAKNKAELAHAVAAAGAAVGPSSVVEGKKPIISPSASGVSAHAHSGSAMPPTPTTPTSIHSGSTIGAGSAITPPGADHDDGASDAPPDPSIRSTKQKKGRAGSLFNRKWNASTDNISLSSTVSSASLMIRKIGSVGALARRKSLTGITSLFKDKDKNKDKDKDGSSSKKWNKSGASAAGVSQIHAEVDRASGDLGISSSDEMVGLSPAAKLARQHTLRSNAEAAARAKQQQLLQEQQQQQQQRLQLQQQASSSSLSGKHVRGYSEDSTEDGFTHLSYNGTTSRGPFVEEEEDDFDDGDDGDVTVRHGSLDEEIEPWAVGVRRSFERTRTPSRGILKHAGTYKQDNDLQLGRSSSLTRSRANSYDTVSAHHQPGPLARIPSADPDHIDGLQSSQSDDLSSLLPPLNLLDISNFSDSPVSSSTHLNASGEKAEKTAASVYTHPNMNSSAPTLTLIRPGTGDGGATRSQTAPAASKRITFAANLSVYDTFSPHMYDRRSEPATCNHLTPALAQRIKEELNSYKMEEMEVHHASRAHTQFFV